MSVFGYRAQRKKQNLEQVLRHVRTLGCLLGIDKNIKNIVTFLFSSTATTTQNSIIRETSQVRSCDRQGGRGIGLPKIVLC